MISSIEAEKISITRPSYYIKTYGCQMNGYDSEAIDGMLYEHNFVPAESEESADIIILNTCSVRDLAEKKVLGKAGKLAKLKRKKPNLVLGIAGCMAQNMKEDLLKRIPGLDIVCGPNDIFQLPELVENALQGERRKVLVNDKSHQVMSAQTPKRRVNRFHAWISVMRGCNHNCTYCIVPRVRGREVSRTIEDILNEAHGLAEEGFKEITLLGQNINSYGRDLGRGVNFPKLLKFMNKIEGLERIRFVTSHPVDIREELINAMADLDKVCEYLHFPFQSGSNRILDRMKRGYTRESYLKTVERLRQIISGVALSTDVIVGFPGETEEDFRATMDLMKEVRFDAAYLFKYSIRTGTTAAQYSDQISEEVKARRHTELLDQFKEISNQNNQKFIGKKLEVLVERDVSKPEESQRRFQARLRDNRLVYFKNNQDCVGELFNIRISRATPFALYGEL